ncbi:MAG: hypothetical protein WCS15_00015 [Prevotella sp.]
MGYSNANNDWGFSDWANMANTVQGAQKFVNSQEDRKLALQDRAEQKANAQQYDQALGALGQGVTEKPSGISNDVWNKATLSHDQEESSNIALSAMKQEVADNNAVKEAYAKYATEFKAASSGPNGVQGGVNYLGTIVTKNLNEDKAVALFQKSLKQNQEVTSFLRKNEEEKAQRLYTQITTGLDTAASEYFKTKSEASALAVQQIVNQAPYPYDVKYDPSKKVFNMVYTKEDGTQVLGKEISVQDMLTTADNISAKQFTFQYVAQSKYITEANASAIENAETWTDKNGQTVYVARLINKNNMSQVSYAIYTPDGGKVMGGTEAIEKLRQMGFTKGKSDGEGGLTRENIAANMKTAAGYIKTLVTKTDESTGYSKVDTDLDELYTLASKRYVYGGLDGTSAALNGIRDARADLQTEIKLAPQNMPNAEKQTWAHDRVLAKYHSMYGATQQASGKEKKGGDNGGKGGSLKDDIIRKAKGRSGETDYGYGTRADGTQKGKGYFGELKRPDGKISTELSIGVNFDGKEVEIPSLVPTLTQEEIKYLLNGGKPTEAIIQKAVDHAKKRMANGRSPFAQDGEQVSLQQGAGQSGIGALVNLGKSLSDIRNEEHPVQNAMSEKVQQNGVVVGNFLLNILQKAGGKLNLAGRIGAGINSSAQSLIEDFRNWAHNRYKTDTATPQMVQEYVQEANATRQAPRQTNATRQAPQQQQASQPSALNPNTVGIASGANVLNIKINGSIVPVDVMKMPPNVVTNQEKQLIASGTQLPPATIVPIIQRIKAYIASRA